MSQTKVSYKRHLAKTITYRILSTTIGFLGMWWVSGDIKIGAAFGVVELIYKPIQYYIVKSPNVLIMVDSPPKNPL